MCRTKSVQKVDFFQRKVNGMDVVNIWYNQPQLFLVLSRDSMWDKKCMKSVFFQQKVNGMDVVKIWYNQPQLFICFVER